MKFTTKLTTLFSGIVLVIIIVISYFVYTANLKMLEKQIINRLENQAFHTMDKIDQTFFGRYADIKILATDSVIRSRNSTSAQIRERLLEYLKERKVYYASLSFFDLNRVRIADTSGRKIGDQHPFTEYWLGIAEGRDFVMDISVSFLLQKPVFHFASIVKDKDGSPFGVVVSRIPIEKLFEIVKQTSAINDVAEGFKKIVLVNKDGLTLYSNYNKKDILKKIFPDWEIVKRLLSTGKKTGQYKHKNEGEEEISIFVHEQGYLDFKGNDWTLIMELPEKIAFASAVELRNRIVIILVTISVFGFLIIFIFSSTITKPLGKLSKTADEIGKGNLDIKIEITSGDEIGQLATSFNKMVLNLRESFQKQQAAKEQYQSLFDNVPVGLYRSTPEGKNLDVNHAMVDLFGYKDRESLLEAKIPVAYVNPVDRVQWQALMKRDGIVRNFEVQVRRHGGEIIWVQNSSRAIKDTEGRLLYYEGSLIDFTERKRSEEKIQQVIKEWETTFNSITDLVSLNDKDLTIIRVNKAYADVFRVRPEELIGKKCYEVIHGLNEPLSNCPHKQIQETRKPVTVEFFDPCLKIDIEESISPIFSETGEFVGSVNIIKNITEHKKLEKQFRQAQKMEAVGRLAGGIAHDFNNLLTAIYGYSEMLLNKLAEGDPLRKYVNEINNAGQRAASLTRQLLAFSRKQVIQPEVLALNAVVTGMKEMIRRLIGEDIELVIIPGAELGRVKADTGQLEQVIMNLAVNSRDAMPKGGKITIETANVEIDEDFARSHFPVKPGSYVMLAVSDTGCGMDKETQTHIFEPFFTTKETGKGTGLGLSTVYGIVKQSKGYIFVNSESGQGTCFEVYLPRIEEALKSLEPSTIPRISFQGSETILLVEDEEAVRQFTYEVLRENGYTVLEARHGGEALLVCERHKGPIHLMLTDVVMPLMNGSELAKCLAPLRPEMKVLYMSGYTDGAFVQKGELEPGISILQKPFTIDFLTSRVREVLDTPKK